MASRLQQQRNQEVLLELLPPDCTTVGNQALWGLFKAAIANATEADFQQAREALVASGHAVKGKGRGGSTSRATGEARPDFDLKAEAVTPDILTPGPAVTPRKPKAAPQATAPGAPQVISYRHPDRRKNNPEVGLVNEASDPEQPKTTYAYDPHLDPVLQFDSARAAAERLIEDALAGNDPAAMRHALEELRRMSSPYLQWTGKAERTSFGVDTVSLHVHERIDAMSILSAVSKRQGKKSDKAAAGGIQPSLFEAPFESLPLRSAVDFYKHDRGWANRLVAGDSLLVMNSLLQKESMAGQVQMIYIDPPYGIKYGSNFQPFTNKRDVKDRTDADLTQEPEMIKAFRDTWELGIHSYLTYLRDRLLLAKDLLSESGSVFVQISDENLHHVRELCDEILGAQNFVSLITFKKTTGSTANLLAGVSDYLVWFAKSLPDMKYRQLYSVKELGGDGGGAYGKVLLPSGEKRALTVSEKTTRFEGGRVFRFDNLTSQSPGTRYDVGFNGKTYFPKGYWKTEVSLMPRLLKAKRVAPSGENLYYVRFIDDFPAFPVNNSWDDTSIAGFASDKRYVVETSTKVVERCLMMCTDPGDLVFDPTCGSGTTAYVAEKWGRRWITCDTSRVAVTLAKQRLMTASFDYYELRYPHEGLKGGFIYKTVPHVTLKSIANNAEIDTIYERLHPAIETALADFNAGLAIEPPAEPWTVTDGVRKGQKLALGMKRAALLE
jgi:adenine-specific DNA-methyltransferase